MLISAREAAELLAPLCVGRESTRRILASGLAGPGQATRASLLYEHELVAALRAWPLVEPSQLDDAVRGGVFVARLSGDLGGVAQAARGPWRISPWLRARISITQERQGFVPLVATIGRQPGRTCTFTLADPGSWFAGIEGHRFPTGPGASWRWWQPPAPKHPNQHTAEQPAALQE